MIWISVRRRIEKSSEHEKRVKILRSKISVLALFMGKILRSNQMAIIVKKSASLDHQQHHLEVGVQGPGGQNLCYSDIHRSPSLIFVDINTLNFH